MFKNRKAVNAENRMKKPLRPLPLKTAVPAFPLLPCAPCLRTPPSSGNVRFCPFTAQTYPGPIRGNPRLRAETCPSGLTGLQKPNRKPGLNGQCNTHPTPPKSLHRVALCCSVLHRVAPKISSRAGATPPLPASLKKPV